MSSPDLIDPRFDELVAELRSARPAAPADVRSRVAGLTAEEPAPARRRFARRRGGLVAAAVVVGVVDSGGNGGQRENLAAEQAVPRPPPSAKTSPLQTAQAPAAQAALPATSAGRTQLYAADLTVRVKDVSAATKRALDLTRSFGGYVRTVDFGQGARSGSADLVVRVPVGSVQAAIVRFSALGRILDQHVSIQDVQPSIDARFRRLQSLRVQIARVQEQLAAPGLTDERQAALEAKLTRARAELIAVQRAQAQARKRASFATVSLGLRTKAAQVVPPPPPSRVDRTLDRIGDVLLVELEVVLYVLAIAIPLAVLAALAVWALRGGRRRSEERLLAR